MNIIKTTQQLEAQLQELTERVKRLECSPCGTKAAETETFTVTGTSPPDDFIEEGAEIQVVAERPITISQAAPRNKGGRPKKQ